MNHKLSGIIFMLFGLGLTGDSSYDLYYNFSNFDFKTIKSIAFLLFGISICIYGFKQFNNTLQKGKSD